MSGKKDQPVDIEIAAATGSTRRSFLQKGAVASVPLVLTAFSRPVLADRCGLSGLTSGNLSDNREYEECGGGRSHGYYKAPDLWPDSEGAPIPGEIANPDANRNQKVAIPFTGTPFHSNCTYDNGLTGIFSGSDYGTMSMFEVVMTDTQPGCHFVAAYLNCFKYDDYLLSKLDVLRLWNEYNTSVGAAIIEDINDGDEYHTYRDVVDFVERTFWY